MEDVNDIATHSEEVTQDTTHPEVEQGLQDAYNAFGLDYAQKESEPEIEVDEESDPPIDGYPEPEQERKGITVRHNKEDVFIEEERIPELSRKGMNYDKIETRNKQYQETLDRVARVQGYKDHTELMENIDRIEQESVQSKQQQFEQFKQDMRTEAEEAGIDPNVLDQYIENHPLLNQAREVLQRSEQEQQHRQEEQTQYQQLQEWQDLFQKYPTLASQIGEDGASAPWLTQQMSELLQSGYKPIHAYDLVHRDSLIADERKKTEQNVIKNQRLNKRSQVETIGSVDMELEVPEELSSAFAMFGLSKDSAKKYANKFNK